MNVHKARLEDLATFVGFTAAEAQEAEGARGRRGNQRSHPAQNRDQNSQKRCIYPR